MSSSARPLAALKLVFERKKAPLDVEMNTWPPLNEGRVFSMSKINGETDTKIFSIEPIFRSWTCL